MLYTKEELDMLKKLSPEDQAQIMKLNKPKKKTTDGGKTKKPNVAFNLQKENKNQPVEMVKYWDGYESRFANQKKKVEP